MSSQSAQIEAGKVILPDGALVTRANASCSFPLAEHDDQVDSTSQFRVGSPPADSTTLTAQSSQARRIPFEGELVGSQRGGNDSLLPR